ncbi:NUDIX domain-containing protein [Stenotrophomonas maltophilia group sp. P373]
MSPVSVKAVIADSSGRVLFLRNPRGELELPGGRPDVGESLEETLSREVLEECGLVVTEAAYLGSRSCAIVPGKSVLLVFYRCGHAGGAIRLSDEHADFRWVEVVGARPEDVPEYYWSAALQLEQWSSVDEGQIPARDLEYPLATGERDRKRLLITADIYDASTKEFIETYLPDRKGRILEVGAGHGSISRWMAKVRPDSVVLGVDSSEQQVALSAREADLLVIRNVSYTVADLREIEEWDGVGDEFDLITCRFTLLHLKERARIVNGLLSRLSVSGVLVLEEPALDSVFCIPSVPAFTRANSAIRRFGEVNGLDYDCIAEIWKIAAGSESMLRGVRFSQPTVWSRAHKELVLLSFMNFKPRLVAEFILDPGDADAIEMSLRHDYMDERVVSGGLRTLQVAMSKATEVNV